jgi:hypothetical protein
MSASPAIATVTATYAELQNAKYNKSASVFMNLKDRLNNTILSLPYTKQLSARSLLKNACAAFSSKFPNKTKFQDLNLVKALEICLSDILIDTTMQRMLILEWVAHIIANFREVQAQPIQIYRIDRSIATEEDLKELGYYPVGNGLYASWDAQHTAVAFYIIATWIFNQNPDDIMVPANIYNVSSKAEIRENFVSGNSSAGKKLLEEIDLFQQQIYGVRLDGNKNPAWVEAEKKQQYIEQAGLFVTADKFGDTHMPGAISRMQEIKKYNSDIIRQFCLYAVTVQPAQGRPIASQEIEIMCAWFDMAKQGGISYTDEQIVDLATHLNKLFSADFHESSQFWTQARLAYAKWWTRYYSGAGAAYKPAHMSFSKNWRNGGTFLWNQLKKTWSGPIPALSINTTFQPDTKDLYQNV